MMEQKDVWLVVYVNRRENGAILRQENARVATERAVGQMMETVRRCADALMSDAAEQMTARYRDMTFEIRITVGV